MKAASRDGWDGACWGSYGTGAPQGAQNVLAQYEPDRQEGDLNEFLTYQAHTNFMALRQPGERRDRRSRRRGSSQSARNNCDLS